MEPNIDNLNADQLTGLQRQIASKLKTIAKDKIKSDKQKNSIKRKTMLKQLTTADRIFGISFRSDGMPVCIGFCDVYNFSVDKKSSEFYSASFNSKILPLGVYGFMVPVERGDKPYCLFTSCSGVYFFTMRPRTWKIDMAEAVEDHISRLKKIQSKEVKDQQKKLSISFQNKAYVNAINKTIKENLTS